jgi:hypothetical protein
VQLLDDQVRRISCREDAEGQADQGRARDRLGQGLQVRDLEDQDGPDRDLEDQDGPDPDLAHQDGPDRDLDDLDRDARASARRDVG